MLLEVRLLARAAGARVNQGRTRPHYEPRDSYRKFPDAERLPGSAKTCIDSHLPVEFSTSTIEVQSA